MRATFGAAGDMNGQSGTGSGEPARVAACIDAGVGTGTTADAGMDEEAGVGRIGDQAKVGNLVR